MKHLGNHLTISTPRHYKGLINNLTEREVRNLYQVLRTFHWTDDTASEDDFVDHLKGNDKGHIPSDKIAWLIDLKGLVILMDALGTHQWKEASQRFVYYKGNTEVAFYNSLKKAGKDFQDEKKSGHPVGKTDTLAQTVVRILDKACGSADTVISKKDKFYDAYI